MTKTVGDYWERLKPLQRQFILGCLQRFHQERYGKLNPGLLYYVPRLDAIGALQTRLDFEMCPKGGAGPDDTADLLVCHSRYIRHLLSVLCDGDASLLKVNRMVAAVTDLFASKDSTIMTLHSPKVYTLAGRRHITHFAVDTHFIKGWTMLGLHTSTEVEFLQRSSSRWRITAHAHLLNKITTVLAENYR